MANRADELIGEVLKRIHDVIHEHDVTYEEYGVVKQWLIDVGEAGEWPLFLDVFVESAVEEQVFRDRDGSQGTILGPYHLPDAPVLDAPYELPRREDEKGDRVDGDYSGFEPRLPEGILRGKVPSGEDGRYEVRTVLPAPYTIPLDGPSGALCAAAGWSPWRPAHIHLIVSADGHEPLVTQLFVDSSEYLDSSPRRSPRRGSRR